MCHTYQNFPILKETIAHELAHGVFSLRHTFSKDYAIAQGSTRNLMDYPTTKTTNATELKKYQWDALHDPKKLIAPWMQNEEEGRMEGIDYKCLPTSITKQNPIEHYYTNTPGKTIKLTEDFIPIAFVGMNDNFGDKKGGVAVIKRVSDGVLFFPARNYQRFPDYYSQLNDGNLNTSDNLYKYLENGDESQALLVEIERDCSYRIIKNNSIIAEDNFKYDCNCIQNERFNENSHILKTISGDLSAEEYNNLVEKLTKRLNTQSSQSEYFSVGEDFKTERDEELQIADLNDRFKVFNTETGNQIFVDVIYTHAKLSNNQLLTLAEDVYKNSNLAHNNNAIYIVLPVWNETIITSHLKSIDKNKFSKSFYSKNETYNNVSDLLGYKGISGNIIDVVEDIYSLIPKPHIIASYAITYSGEIIRFKLQKTANVSGNNFIYDFRLAVDNLLHTYIQQVKIIESSQPNIPPKGYGASRNTTEYHNQAILRAMDAQERIHNLRINNDNIEYKIIKHGLFESALTPNSEGISEVAQQFVEWYVRHEFGMSASSPADTYFKIGKNEVVYQETLNTIDKIGLLLMPLGLDIITDGIGAIYAGYYYDIETASYYVGGVVVAGVSGAVFRQLATRSKKISRVSGEFKIVDNVVHQSDDIASYMGKIPKELQKKLDALPDGGHKFLDDFANAPDDILKKFLDNPELVEAWKVLDDAKVNAVLRKDPSWLNRVSNWTDEGLEVASGGKILRNGDEVGRIVGNRLHIKYTGYGGDIVCDATKTTTGIGKYSPPRDVGTKQIIDSKLSKSGESPGGINILNDTRNTQRWSDQKIWDEINEPWLRDAINRGDNIRAVSDPMNVENVFKATDNIPSSVLLSPEKLANYLKNLNDPNIIKDLSFYGREIRYLYQNNYLFDLTSKTFAR